MRAARGDAAVERRAPRDEQHRVIAAHERRVARVARWFFWYTDLAHVYRINERHAATLRLLYQAGYHPLCDARILDVGCGDGHTLRQFLQWGAEPEKLAGIDLRPEAVAYASRLNPTLDLRCGSAAELPWGDESFDLVSAHTVFSSILDPAIRRRVAAEMSRVLRPGRSVLWYDFMYDNPANPDVRRVTRQEIHALFPGFRVDLRRITLATPLARRLPEGWLPVLYPALSAIPVLRTHYLGLLTKTGSGLGALSGGSG